MLGLQYKDIEGILVLCNIGTSPLQEDGCCTPKEEDIAKGTGLHERS
jgi:hypothetical protein